MGIAGSAPEVFKTGQVRRGMGAYAGGARRNVHHATVLLRLPSDNRLGRRRVHYIHILQNDS